MQLKVRRGGAVKSKTATDVTLRRMSTRWLDAANAVWDAVDELRAETAGAHRSKPNMSISREAPAESDQADDEDISGQDQRNSWSSGSNMPYTPIDGKKLSERNAIDDSDSDRLSLDALRSPAEKRRHALTQHVSTLFKLTETERCASRAHVDTLENALRSQTLGADQVCEQARNAIMQLLEGQERLRERVRILERERPAFHTDKDEGEVSFPRCACMYVTMCDREHRVYLKERVQLPREGEDLLAD